MSYLHIDHESIHAPFSWTLHSRTGGIPPYTWTVSPSSLPAGLTFSTVGAITGTPTQLLLSGVKCSGDGHGPRRLNAQLATHLNCVPPHLRLAYCWLQRQSLTLLCRAKTVTFTAAGANGTQPYNYAWSGVVSSGLSTGTTKSFPA